MKQLGAGVIGSGTDVASVWHPRKNALVLSVCTGAFKVAEAGLLDDKTATTHHDFYIPICWDRRSKWKRWRV